MQHPFQLWHVRIFFLMSNYSWLDNSRFYDNGVMGRIITLMGNFLPLLTNTVGAHKGSEDLRDQDGAILLLIVFEDSNERAANREA